MEEPDQKPMEPWPSECCVAAFVVAALAQLGYSGTDRVGLARRLGTRVGPDKPNPWGLTVESDPKLVGVQVADAKRLVPPVLKEFNDDLCFRHVPFSKITLGLFAELLNQILSRGAIAGIGFNYAPFVGRSDTLRHVVRIIPTSDAEKVMLLDDTVGSPPREFLATWAELIPQVHAVSDGFWIIGRRGSMRLDYAPAWDEERP